MFKISDDGISYSKATVNEAKLSDPLICMKPPQLSTNKHEMDSLNIAQNPSGSKTGNNVRDDLKAEFGVEEFLRRRKTDVRIKK